MAIGRSDEARRNVVAEEGDGGSVSAVTDGFDRDRLIRFRYQN
jgi:hypothetical protein